MSKYYSSACKSDRFGLDKLGILSWIVASAGNFADIAFLAAADGELWEAGAVADRIVLLFLLKLVFVAACSHFPVFLTAALLSQAISLACFPMSLTRFQLAAGFLLRSCEILLGGWFLAAAWRVGCFEAGMIVLVVGVVLVAGAIAALGLGSSGRLLFADATFLHLVLVAVFVFVETLPERLFSLSLMEPDAVFIEQAFYFAGCFAVVADWTGGSVILFLFYFFLF
jgi:hypothetical protein